MLKAITHILFSLIFFGFSLGAMEYSKSDQKMELFNTLGLIYTNDLIVDDNFEFHPLNTYEQFSAPLYDLADKLMPQCSEANKKYLFPLNGDVERIIGQSPKLQFFINSNNVLFVVVEVVTAHQKLQFLDGVSLKSVPEVDGLGAFALRDFNKEQIIGEYVGELRYCCTKTGRFKSICRSHQKISSDKIMERLRISEQKSDSYLAFYLKGHPELFSDLKLGKNPDLAFLPLVIDQITYRNETGFLNHSREHANAKMTSVLFLKIIPGVSNRVLQARIANMIISTREITKGEQLLIDYGWDSSLTQKRCNSLLELTPDDGRDGCFTCGAKDSSELKLKACARCAKATYCSKEHQTSDWPRHKQYCAALQQRKTNTGRTKSSSSNNNSN